MTRRRIIGISLVRNEDVFVGTAIRNILAFCDRIVVADHGSSDHTWQTVEGIARRHSHVEVHRVKTPGESHSLIEGFAGSPAWIFGVDGDEIYDPVGLAALRPKIVAGQYDEWWQLFGNVLNCTEIDYDGMKATGYLAPPSRSITKLLNFSAIDSWKGPSAERLHGGTRVFRSGYHDNKRLDLHATVGWEDAELRCLHTCFMRRSSQDEEAAGVRMNIVEKNQQAGRPLLSRLLRHAFSGMGRSPYKKEKYMRGPIVQRDVSAFFDARHAARAQGVEGA